MIQTTHKGRRELTAMIAVAVLPFVIAIFLFTIFPNEEIPSQNVEKV